MSRYLGAAREAALMTARLAETPHARSVREAAARERPVHPAHSTAPVGGLGIDLTLPCGCDDPMGCPCRCHPEPTPEGYEADPKVWPCPDGPYCRLGCRPLEVK